MIDKALGFLVDELNRHFTLRYPGGEPLAVLEALDASESAASSIENKLVLSLLGIEKESAAAAVPSPVRESAAHGAPGVAAGFSRMAAPLPLNLNVMLAASFGGSYREALKVLSAAIGFFQATPGFTRQSAAALPAGIERLSIEMVSCDIATLSNVWSVLGANYMPSSIYKVRMLTIQQGWMSGFDPAVGGTSTELGPRL